VVACEAAQEADRGGLLGDAEEDNAPARHRYLRTAPPLDAPGGAARHLWTAHMPEEYRWAALIDRALNRMEYELTARAATAALGANEEKENTNDNSEDSYRSAAGWNGETGGVAGREVTKYFCKHS
jgi:hypothetical protein